MELIEGSFYRSKNGFVFGPLRSSLGGALRAADGDNSWHKDGRSVSRGKEYDLVEEIIPVDVITGDAPDEDPAYDELLGKAAELASFLTPDGNTYVLSCNNLITVAEFHVSLGKNTTSKVKDLNARISKLQAELVEARAKSTFNVLSDAHENLKADFAKANKRVDAVTKQRDDEIEENGKLSAEIDKMKADALRANERDKEQQTEIKRLSEVLVCHASTTKQLVAERDSLQRQLAQYVGQEPAPKQGQIWIDCNDVHVTIVAVTERHMQQEGVVVFRDLGSKTTRHRTLGDFKKEYSHVED